MADNYAIKTSFIGVDRMSKVFNKMQKGAKGALNRISGAMERLNRKTKKFRQLAGKVTAFAGLAGGIYLAQSALTSTIQKGVEFEKTMVSASVKFGDSAARGTKTFDRLRKEALKVGLETELSASQAAEGFKVMARAGFTAEQSLKSVRLMADLATASEMELAKATGIMADSLGAFEMKTKDPFQLEKNITRISDVVLTATETMANFTMDDFYETMKMAGPIFSNAGKSIEEFTGITAILAESGIKGSQAATVLKNAIANLTAPSKTMRQIMKDMKISIEDSNGKMISMVEIVRKLNDSSSKYTQVQRMAALSTLFGKRATAGMLATMAQGPEKLNTFIQKLQQVDGNTKKFASTMRDTSEGRLKAMESAIESLQLTIFDGLQPVMDDITKGVREFTEGIVEYIKANPNFIKDLTTTAATILKIIAAIIALNAAMTVLNTLMAVFAVINPFGWIAIAILAVIALALILYNHWEKIVELFIIAKDAAIDFGKAIIKHLLAPIFTLIQTWGKFLSMIGKVAGVEMIANVGESMKGFGKDLFKDEAAEEPANRLYTPAQTQAEIYRSEEVNQSYLTIEDKTGRAKLTGESKNIKMSSMRTAESY